MQINNIQSPSFGMALKIEKNAQKLLQETPISTLKKLNRVGKNIQDTKHFHIRVDKDSCKIHSNGDAPFGMFKMGEYTGVPTWKNKDAIVIKKNNDEIATVTRTFPYSNALPQYIATDKAGNLLTSINKSEELAKIVKILDNAAIKKYSEIIEKPETNKSKQIDKLVNTLMKKYEI